MAVTLNDIARLANVDKSTVSMTLRNHPNARNLRRETREKIRKIADELGYCSNENAISLRTGNIKLIALIADDSPRSNTLLYFNIPGIIRAASERGYGVKIFTDCNIEETFRRINADRITYVLSLSIHEAKRQETAFCAEKMGLDLVYFFEHAHGKYPSVNVDNIRAGCDAVKYLISKGHSRIGFVATGMSFQYQRDRYDGFCKGLKESELPLHKSFIINQNEDIFSDMEKLLSLPAEERPTAFFCSTDSLALKVQHCALKMDLKLPEELSVVGFSNSNVCPMAAVPLTSMDENFDERAFLAIKVLFKEIGKENYPSSGTFMVSSRIVERESVYDLKNHLK